MSLRAARLLLQRAAPVGAQAWRRGAPALALRSAQSLRASRNGAPPPSDNAPKRSPRRPKELEPHDWHPVVDPETQGTYYHNPMTGLVTAVGVEKPVWEPVEAQGGVYWWNIDTDETTAIGEPCPALQQQGQGGQLQQQQGFALGQPQQQGGGMMSGLGQTMAQGWRSAPEVRSRTPSWARCSAAARRPMTGGPWLGRRRMAGGTAGGDDDRA